MPKLTAQAVADLVGGRLLGDGRLVLDGIGPLDRAGPDTLSLLVSARYLPYFRASSAGAVLISEALAREGSGPTTRIVVADPHRALLTIIPAFCPSEELTHGVDPTARLGPGVTLGSDVSIGPYVVLERAVRIGARSRLGPGVVVGDAVTIGDDCVLGPHVVCHAGTQIGNRVILKAGAVIGGAGFGYVSGADGHLRIPHIGRCVLEDDVEIGSGTCLDRGSIDDTSIGQGTKIDNLVQIGHNVRVGRRCLIMACVGIAGSVRIGDDVIIAGHTGIADHLTIGDRARVAAKSAVFGHVEAGATVGGHPARQHRQFLRGQAALHRIIPIIDDLEALVSERGRHA